jgi:shikimate kinase
MMAVRWGTDVMSPFLSETVVLIGLPGCGKSTLGELLARHYKCLYADTDRAVESVAGCHLQELIDRDGVSALRALESRVIESLTIEAPAVISTGGSVVYSPAAMQHLKRLGRVIYLRAAEATIVQRLGNYSDRGIVRLPGQSLSEVIAERLPLYEHYADAILDVDGMTVASARDALLELISVFPGRSV